MIIFIGGGVYLAAVIGLVKNRPSPSSPPGRFCCLADQVFPVSLSAASGSAVVKGFDLIAVFFRQYGTGGVNQRPAGLQARPDGIKFPPVIAPVPRYRDRDAAILISG